MDPERDYFLVLADLRDSTQVEPAKAAPVLAGLEGALAALNAAHRPSMALQISYGDEVAGFFDTPAGLYEVVSGMRAALRPVRARFVVSEGRIGAPSADIRRVGGPAFKQANEAMKALKSSGRFCRWLLKDARLNQTLDALTQMSDALIVAMTDHQYNVYRLLAQGMSQKEAAEQLGKFPQSVSDAVKRGHIDLAIDGEAAIRALLAR